MTIRHHQGSYELQFSDWTTMWANLKDSHFVVTDSNVVKHVPIPDDKVIFVVPAGEESKNISQFAAIQSQLAERGAKRSDSLVALGGGVIGDLAGFVASTYMRGISFTQVPTSLLAMVDSSIGGKVGIDLPEGKNLVGTFSPPTAVWVNTEALKTLPARHITNGFAEVYKMGLIRDLGLIDLLSHRNTPSEVSTEIIERALEGKKAVVEADEFETTGLRATLNFGHTFGHAIETITGYSEILHGEAIAMGMVAEALLGEALGFTAKGTSQEVLALLQWAGLPTHLDHLKNAEEIVTIMSRDKKATSAGLAFSFLQELGSCKLQQGISMKEVSQWLRTL